jgi:hypothetical protein
MLLAGFNFTEFIQDRFLRNSPPAARKKLWTWIYFFLTFTSGICVFINVTEFKYLLPFIIIAGLIFLLLTKLKLHKTILSEFLTFAVLSILGLIAYNPHNNTSLTSLFPLWLLMFLYFSSAIFLVKIRFERVNITGILLYITVSAVVLLLTWGNVLIIWLVISLMLLRFLPITIFRNKFKNMKITTIGFIETGFQILFLACILVSLK